MGTRRMGARPMNAHHMHMRRIMDPSRAEPRELRARKRRIDHELVEYLPPSELPDADFPFFMNTGRQMYHWHTGTMTRRSQALDARESTATSRENRRAFRRIFRSVDARSQRNEANEYGSSRARSVSSLN